MKWQTPTGLPSKFKPYKYRYVKGTIRAELLIDGTIYKIVEAGYWYTADDDWNPITKLEDGVGSIDFGRRVPECAAIPKGLI
jgi:hypothetical protein